MTLKELYNSHPNVDAEIIVKTNVINVDEESFDEESEFDIMSADSPYDDFIELIVYPKIIKDPADIDNSIQDFLQVESKINIEIDLNNGIYITDPNGGLLREIDLVNPPCDIETVLMKLRKIL